MVYRCDAMLRAHFGNQSSVIINTGDIQPGPSISNALHCGTLAGLAGDFTGLIPGIETLDIAACCKKAFLVRYLYVGIPMPTRVHVHTVDGSHHVTCIDVPA